MNFKLFIVAFIVLFQCCQLQADPWGKDADLCSPPPAPCPQKRIPTPFIGNLSECLINFHQKVISPADGPRSHFYPSSSQYTLDAMRKYGFLHGFFMGCDRLMRENNEEWIYPKTKVGSYTLKLDPVR
jgi:uncharacterized protein